MVVNVIPELLLLRRWGTMPGCKPGRIKLTTEHHPMAYRNDGCAVGITPDSAFCEQTPLDGLHRGARWVRRYRRFVQWPF